VPGLVTFYDIQVGDGVGLFSAPEPTRGDFDRNRSLMPVQVSE